MAFDPDHAMSPSGTAVVPERTGGAGEKRNYFTRYEATARQVLEGLLDKYADSGVEQIEDIKILQLDPFSRLGTLPELVGAFGGKPGYQRAVRELEKVLYQA